MRSRTGRGRRTGQLAHQPDLAAGHDPDHVQGAEIARPGQPVEAGLRSLAGPARGA
jgi:hypothetical protein